MPARLVVTIDTEEEGLWGGNYRPQGNTVDNIRGVPRFQALCDRFGVRPSYLVDWPVVDDDRAAEILAQITHEDRAEIGAHLHPWCNPPFEETPSPRLSFMCNLPLALQRQKLARLTDRIAERFGRRPTSFRAGRYGLDLAGARLLAELGYAVDSSVIPFSDFSDQAGPNFSTAPWTPYRVGEFDLCRPAERGALLEAPVSVGFSRSNFRQADRFRRWAHRTPWRQLKAVGIVDRLGLARRIKLSPEQATGAEMIQLIEALLAQRAPLAVLMFHSSSLVAGLSPYVPTTARLERFYRDLEEVFGHCFERRGMQAATLGELADVDWATAGTTGG